MESSVSLMKSRCLSCFMIFYLRERRVGPMRGVGLGRMCYYVLQCVRVDEEEEEL